jgi:hypothetical protein
MNIDAQDRRDITDFNQSFIFNNTFQIHVKNNISISTEVVSGVFVAKFTIDKNGIGRMEFVSEVIYLDEISKESKKSSRTTILKVDDSQIKKIDSRNITHWVFQCSRIESLGKLLITLEINPESSTVQRFIIFDESNEKTFFFY